MRKLTKEDADRLRNVLSKREVAFFFIPSAKLCDMIIKDEHPLIKSLPVPYKQMFLEDRASEKQSAPLIQTEMVIKYLQGTLDRANTFILDNGEIRTIDNSVIVDIKKGK